MRLPFSRPAWYAYTAVVLGWFGVSIVLEHHLLAFFTGLLYGFSMTIWAGFYRDRHRGWAIASTDHSIGVRVPDGLVLTIRIDREMRAAEVTELAVLGDELRDLLDRTKDKEDEQ